MRKATNHKDPRVRIVDAVSGEPPSGPSFRKPRNGHESELVEWFLQTMPISIPKGHSVTIFREPRVESGYPDLVAVTWRESIASAWHHSRVDLTTRDLRIAHLIRQFRSATTKQLSVYYDSHIHLSLERLLTAGVVRHTSSSWKLAPLKKSFAATSIIAIEAKISDFRSALSQAYLNTWFASDSVALFPHVPNSTSLLTTAQSLGLHVWTPCRAPFRISASKSSRLPRSYASWLFNEWVWRAELSSRGEICE